MVLGLLLLMTYILFYWGFHLNNNVYGPDQFKMYIYTLILNGLEGLLLFFLMSATFIFYFTWVFIYMLN